MKKSENTVNVDNAEVRAVSKFIRISPRKTRLVADLVRGKNALTAVGILQSMNKRAARVISKTLNSAISNAKNKEMEEASLMVSKVLIDGGPLFKRYMPRAMGRATMIQKPTSHVTVVLRGVVIENKKDTKKKTKKEKAEKKEE